MQEISKLVIIKKAIKGFCCTSAFIIGTGILFVIGYSMFMMAIPSANMAIGAATFILLIVKWFALAVGALCVLAIVLLYLNRKNK